MASFAVVAQRANNIPFTPRFFPLQTQATDAVGLLQDVRIDVHWSIWDVTTLGSPVLIDHGPIVVPAPPGS